MCPAESENKTKATWVPISLRRWLLNLLLQLCKEPSPIIQGLLPEAKLWTHHERSSTMNCFRLDHRGTSLVLLAGTEKELMLSDEKPVDRSLPWETVGRVFLNIPVRSWSPEARLGVIPWRLGETPTPSSWPWACRLPWGRTASFLRQQVRWSMKTIVCTAESPWTSNL